MAASTRASQAWPDDGRRRATFDLEHGREPSSAAIELDRKPRDRDWAIWAGLGMFVVGLLMAGGAVVVILLIGRRASRHWTTG